MPPGGIPTECCELGVQNRVALSLPATVIWVRGIESLRWEFRTMGLQDPSFERDALRENLRFILNKEHRCSNLEEYHNQK